MTKQIYLCTDKINGILSAIYDAWKESRNKEAGIKIQGTIDSELFCEYTESIESEKKARAVVRLIQKYMGDETWRVIYYALLSDDSQRADAVFHLMQEARKIPSGHRIMEHLTNPSVMKVITLSRKVSREAHAFHEFLRFQELENGVLFSQIEPKQRILTCIGEHFANRFPLENWIIYDKTHREYLLHSAKKRWVLLSGAVLNPDAVSLISEKEKEYKQLWKTFFHVISIKERENLKCQKNNLPLRYRRNLTEFEEEN